MVAALDSVTFDKQDQVDQVRPWLVPGEELRAVLDCKGAGTGFVAITDCRVLYYDRAFMRKRKALVSVPYSRIATVSSVDEGGLFRATSMLTVRPMGGEDVEFEFRGTDKAHLAYTIIMQHLLAQR